MSLPPTSTSTNSICCSIPVSSSGVRRIPKKENVHQLRLAVPSTSASVSVSVSTSVSTSSSTFRSFNTNSNLKQTKLLSSSESKSLQQKQIQSNTTNAKTKQKNKPQTEAQTKAESKTKPEPQPQSQSQPDQTEPESVPEPEPEPDPESESEPDPEPKSQPKSKSKSKSKSKPKTKSKSNSKSEVFPLESSSESAPNRTRGHLRRSASSKPVYNDDIKEEDDVNEQQSETNFATSPPSDLAIPPSNSIENAEPAPESLPSSGRPKRQYNKKSPKTNKKTKTNTNTSTVQNSTKMKVEQLEVSSIATATASASAIATPQVDNNIKDEHVISCSPPVDVDSSSSSLLVDSIRADLSSAPTNYSAASVLSMKIQLESLEQTLIGNLLAQYCNLKLKLQRTMVHIIACSSWGGPKHSSGTNFLLLKMPTVFHCYRCTLTNSNENQTPNFNDHGTCASRITFKQNSTNSEFD
jgi:hypothetical protein